MSSDESDREPPKRKIRRIDDTPASTSSTSPVIGFSSGRRLRSHDRNPIQSSDSESGSPIISRSLRRLTRLPSNSEESSSGSPPIRRSLKPRRLPSNSDSDVSDSPLIRKHTRLRTTIIFSDNESDASDRGFQDSSQWETDFSDNEIASNQQSSSKAIHDTNIDSDSSDGNSDKCPICLVSFKKQEIGTPEACDHTFCLDCIMEWSKNVNTCPVDRQEYQLILVREHINGNVINQIPIEKPASEPEIDDDTSHCEICGSTDNEDRMLLCDGCNLGFHIYCLNPPLDAVPSDDYWYCNDCDNAVSVVDHLDGSEIDFLLGDDDDYPRPPRRTRSLTERLIPRTRQSERVRRRVVSNRRQQNESLSPEHVDSVTSSTPNSRQWQRRRRTNCTRRRGRRTTQFRTEYVIDEVTGETVAVQRRVKAKKRRTRRGRYRTSDRTTSRPATVKNRIARQLSMSATGCSSQNSSTAIAPTSIDGLRHRAGIPTLHLFGQNNQLDYFSGEDEDYEVGSQLLARRAPTHSDVAVLRRAASRKAVMMPNSVTSSTDLLDSILNSQEQFHSRNASYSLDANGKFKIESKNFNTGKSIDVTKQTAPVKQTPYNPNRNNYYNNRYNNYSNRDNNYSGNNYNRRQNNYYNSNSNQNYYNSTPSSSMQYSNSYHRGGNRFEDNDRPQDYTQRTLCASSDINPQETREREEEGAGNSQNSESEVDIYSDIETVTTSRLEESDLKPPPTPPEFPSELMGDDDDSEPDMVIDEKNQETAEDTAVTSTVGYMSFPFPPPNFPPPLSLPPIPPSLNFPDEPPLQFPIEPHFHLSSNEEPHLRFSTAAASASRPSYSTADSSMEIQSQAVQSSAAPQRKLIPYDDDEEDENSGDGCPNSNIYSKQNTIVATDMDDDSNDGCPNFSIYSKESKNVALHTDISLPSMGSLAAHQVREISSSPKIADIPPPPNDDANDMYNPEEETELSEGHLDEAVQETIDDTNNEIEEPPSPPEEEEDNNEKAENQVDTPAEERENLESSYDVDIQEEVSDKVENTDQTYENINTSDAESVEQNKSSEYSIEKKLEQMEEGVSENNLDESMETSQQEPSSSLNISNNDDNEKEENLQTEGETDEGATNDDRQPLTEEHEDVESQENEAKSPESKNTKTLLKGGITGGLYSDSEDENVVKKNDKGEISFGISDINDMTEDISEEERSYTPCLDEKRQRQGLEGLDTEMISDDDKNDFEESHEMKTVDDGDALEINAKESELDFTRPEDYEEGEIVDKNKVKAGDEEKEAQEADPKPENEEQKEASKSKKDADKSEKKSKKKVREKVRDRSADKENEANKESFKKLSKNNKERNYRDKDKEKGGSPNRSKEKEKSAKEKEKDRKKEKRKELERYNVRALIAEKPRPLVVKDQFGRDVRQTPSRSRSRSYTPPPRRSVTPRTRESVSRHRSTSKTRKSISRTHQSPNRSRRSLSRRREGSKDRGRKRRRSRNLRSPSRSRNKKRPSSKNKKRKRSSRERFKRKSRDRGERRKKKRVSSRNRRRSRSDERRAREWEMTEWSPPMLQPDEIHAASPSWTPPRMMDNAQALRGENLTVTLNNTSKRKRDRRKGDKRNKENMESRRRRRIIERERTPPPSKEVFASGDNILVSVSFNNESEVRDVTTKDRRKVEEARKKKERRRRSRQDLSGVKPVAIIDLARSPFREITSPKAVIILTDESDNDHEHNNDNSGEQNICDSSQQVASPERNLNYSTGPKTPPEPQVKFTLISKTPQVRAINNPLHEPDDMETNDIHEELESRLNDNMHNGPSTPPEPPNSPPSSPDAYDPFEPTKSRSPTPEPSENMQSLSTKDNVTESRIDSLSGTDLEKAMNPLADISKSMTPPLLDIQPADSQSSIQATPDDIQMNSPERTGVNQSTQPSATSKPVAQTTPFSSVPTSIISSTPISSNMATSRINILNSTVISAPASSIPQRIVLPNQVKSSPVKISPTKAAIKLTPIKPMPTKNNKSSGKKRTLNNSSSLDEIVLDFDSPYSPGSSDYEDLFEPPSEIVTKPMIKNKMKSPSKHHSSTFDNLFNSPSYKPSVKPKEKSKSGKKNVSLSRTKTVGVKLDEDNLKILDELPNSAVEMLVKDKFLKKLQRLERVVEEVKHVLKPHYNKKRISKEEYKDIMRKSVPKICHNKSGEINPSKIQKLVEAYVRKLKHNKKVTSSSSVKV